MGKLFTDATGKEIVQAIKQIPSTGAGGGGSGGDYDLTLPPIDGKSYVMRDGKWVEALIATGTGSAVPSPKVEQINQEGETNVTFFLPWKYAQKETRTALNDVAHASWKFPFTAGTITKVSIKAGVAETNTVDVLMNGSSVLGEPVKPTTAWKDYPVDVSIAENFELEIYTSMDILASDLSISVTMAVGNKTVQFVGGSDVAPNVYVKGSRAATWGAEGQDSPDGQFRSIYMPTVDRLRQLYVGFAARDAENSGKWYICGGLKYLSKNMSAVPSTPIEFPFENVDDLGGFYSSSTVVGVQFHQNDDEFSKYTSGAVTSLPAGNLQIKFLPHGLSLAQETGITADKLTAHKMTGGSTYVYTITNGLTIERICCCRSTFEAYLLLSNNILIRTTGVNAGAVIPFDKGKIKNIFSEYVGNGNLFVVTENNELYAQGVSTSGSLGLSPVEGDNASATYSTLTKVGVWDVKDIQSMVNCTFMLTNDGKLYHTGAACTPLGVTQHNAFTQVFPNYRFHDIALAISNISTDATLVAIAEYLGEIATE